MILFTGTISGRKYSITVTPADERTTRDSMGIVHEKHHALAIGVITSTDKITVENMMEREYYDASPEMIKADLVQRLWSTV
jgi:hypothetical protein